MYCLQVLPVSDNEAEPVAEPVSEPVSEPISVSSNHVMFLILTHS